MFQTLVASSERAIGTTHVAATTWLKPLKRFFRGKGEMMKAFEAIEDAYYAADIQTLRGILEVLKADPPPFWCPRYQKTVQLVLLAQYLLTTNPRAKSAAKFRIQLTLDPAHELSRRITAFLEEIARPY